MVHVAILYVCYVYMYDNNITVVHKQTASAKDGISPHNKVSTKQISNSDKKKIESNMEEQEFLGPDTRLFVQANSDIPNEHAFKHEILVYEKQMQLGKHCATGNRVINHHVNASQKGGQEVYANCTNPRVPNIVHFVWLWDKPEPYKFRQLLGGLSVVRVLKPCAIVFWNAGYLPTGPWWKEFVGNVTTAANKSGVLFFTPNITTPLFIAGKKAPFEAHKSDIVRLYALKYFGGIYLDFDVIILKSFAPLRCYDMTMGREASNGIPNNIMLAVPYARFIDIWLDKYEQDYRPRIWAYNSVLASNTLINTVAAGLVHVEKDSINRPNWMELEKIFEGHFNWKTHYALHLVNSIKYSEQRTSNENPETIKSFNSSFGEIARYIYYEIEMD